MPPERRGTRSEPAREPRPRIAAVEPLDERRRTSFDAMAEEYEAARPGYPEALLREVLARTGARRVVEVGAGTGQATLPLARLGCEVVALEPGPRLAAILRRKAAELPRVRVVETPFEAWEPDDSGRRDLVLAAQSFHWVDPAVRYAAAARAAPHLAVLVNVVESVDPDVRAEFDRAYDRWTGGGEGNACARRAVEIARRRWPSEIAGSGLYGPVHVVERRWEDVHTAASYVRRVSTYSDHATLPEAARLGLCADLSAAIGRHGGRLVVPTLALAFLAEAV
jgi:SAM-dependent methyltransferase